MSGGVFDGSEYIRDARVGLTQAKAVYLGDKKIWPPPKPVLTTFSTAGSYTYTIPEDCDCIDVILLGGGEAGTGITWGNGSGGKAGSWVTVTLVRGVDIPWSTTSITGVVGAGGTGNGGDGTPSTAVISGGSTYTAAGGSGNMGLTVPGGQGAGTQVFNGMSYVGGGGQGSLGNTGNAPGGGGAGGGFGTSVGGNGAVGCVWFYAYSTAPRPFQPGPPRLSPGAVGFDAAGTGSAGASGSVSWSHTIANPDEDGMIAIVFVKVAKAAGGSISAYTITATYGGVTMNQWIGYNDNNGTDGFMRIFYLFKPPTGTQTVEVNVNNSPTRVVCQSVTYYNVDVIDSAYSPPLIGTSGTAVSWTADNHITDATIFAVSALGTITASSGGNQRYISSNAAGSLLLRDTTGVAAETAYTATRSSGAQWLQVHIGLRSNVYQGQIDADTFKGGSGSVQVSTASPSPLTWDTTSISQSDENTMLIVGIVIGATNNTGTCTADVTMGGIAMTPIGTPGFVYRDATYGGAFQGLYGIMNPGTGVKTISVTAGGTCVKHGIIGGAVILKGMAPDVAAPVTYNVASGTTASYSIPSAAGQFVVGIIISGYDLVTLGPGHKFAGADIAVNLQHANNIQMFLRPGYTSGSTTISMTQSSSARMTGIGTVLSPMPPP